MGIKSLLLGVALGATAVVYASSDKPPVTQAEEAIQVKPGQVDALIKKWEASPDAKKLTERQRASVENSWNQSLYANMEMLKTLIADCKNGDNKSCNDMQDFVSDIRVALKDGPSSAFLD